MIKTLTPEQEAQIPAFIKKWVDRASEPINRKKLPDFVKGLFGEDKIVIVGESLQNTIDLIKVATKGEKLAFKIYTQLRTQLDNQLDNQLYTQLRTQLDTQLDNQLYNQLRTQLDTSYSFYCGFFWAKWCSWYDYGKYIGVQLDESKLHQLFDYIETMPMAIFVGNVIFICEKPKCSWNQQGWLHDTKFPAIRWNDGTGIYLINGVQFEKGLFERVTSKQMLLKEVLKIEDIDQRKQAMRFVNVWDFVKEAKGKELDTYIKTGKDGRKIRYWLYEFPADPDLFPKGAKYMIYDDSMVGAAEQHMQGIAPEVNPKTVPEAMAWKQSDDLYTLTPEEWEALELDVHFT